MSEQRFRPNPSSTNRTVTRVPVTRPVGRPQPQPTQSFEREESHSFQPSFQESHNQPKMSVPPMMNFEDEYIEEENKKSKSNLIRNLIIGFIGLAVVIGIIFAVMKFAGNDEVPLVDGSKVTQGAETNPLSEKTPAPVGEKTETVDFNGNPIPVKWPADVKPTRMEIQLDPTTGKPVLLLVGDKAGLGTVIRSYDQTGKLSGYWVIVPDNQEQQNTATQNDNSSQNGEQQNNQNSNE